MKLFHIFLAALLLGMGSTVAHAEVFDLSSARADFDQEEAESIANQSSFQLMEGLRQAQERNAAARPAENETDTVTEISEPEGGIGVNIVAEVGTPIRAFTAPRGIHQAQTGDIDFIRVAAEVVRPGEKIFPYVAIGMWKTNKNGPWYLDGEQLPKYTKFAAIGIGIRSSGNPQPGQVVFQANGGVGFTIDRDEWRTTASHIFEGQVSATYHLSRSMAIRLGASHYSTGEGLFYTPRNSRWANRGEERLTIGLTFRV